LTKKELIEGGWIDKYILGLTSDEESQEVERIAALYPDVQDEINRSRSRICGKFNRNLTQPALRHSLLSKRRILYGAGISVVLLIGAMTFICREHFSLQRDFSYQSQMLAEKEAHVNQLASFSRMASEQSVFLHAPDTKRIKLKGCEPTPEAEVMVFQCGVSGKMMLRVIDLPELASGQHYEVWAHHHDDTRRLVGKIAPPLRFDSLYVLDTALHFTSLEINSVDPMTQESMPVCLASILR
jgi:hypothetical protein